MTAVPPTDWIKDIMHSAYGGHGWGPIEVQIMRPTDDDAIVQVILHKQKSREGGTATSTFRFQSGNGDMKRQIEKEVRKAVNTMEVAIYRETHRKLDG